MWLRSRQWFATGVLVVLGAASLEHPRALVADSPPKPGDAARQSALINRVIDHLRVREERIESLHVTWESRSQPRVDLWIEGTARYRVDLRSAPDDAVRRQAFDGETTRFYDATERRGDITAGDPGPVGVRLFPIWLLVKPLSRYGLEPSPAKWQVVGEKAIIDNLHCVKLQTTHQRRRETIWIDPARDDLIVAWELHRRRSDTLVTIGYRRDKKLGWVPERWTETTPGRSRATETKIVDYSINESAPRELFAPPFPPETTVLDGAPWSGISSRRRARRRRLRIPIRPKRGKSPKHWSSPSTSPSSPNRSRMRSTSSASATRLKSQSIRPSRSRESTPRWKSKRTPPAS